MADFDRALRQAKIIEHYWAERGQTVECRLIALAGEANNLKHVRIDPHYAIRSTMLNGLPRELAMNGSGRPHRKLVNA